jgi:D-arabinose 1-dehydrogenase-like Zn-dependent alcohol dehydrogenase
MDKIYSLDQFNEALERMETGNQFGKIVLEIAK